MKLFMPVWTGAWETNGLLTWLVSYWKADTSWSFPDAHGSNNGTISGASYTASWKINGAYSYDGTNDDINLNITNLSTYDDVSFSCWFNTTTTWTTQLIMWNDLGLRILIDGGNVVVQSRSTTAVFSSISSSTTASTYHHAVVTFKKNGDMILYLNWSNVASTTVVDRENADTYWVYLWVDNRGSKSLYFSWDIDEAWFWQKDLTATEVTALYNSGSWLSYDDFTS